MNSNRTSIVSVEEINKRVSKEYEITDGGNSNMKVVVRVRPENSMEMRSNCETVVRVLDEHVLVFDPKEDNDPAFQGGSNGSLRKRRALLSRKRRDLRFAFDRVFDENSTQVEVFENTTKSVIDGLLDGVNCSVFAYGATGAGKTYTMLGTLDDPGVMFLTTMELYRRIDQLKHEKNCQVAVTYLEVYNETIRDLLSPSGPLPMREDSSKGLVVSGLTQHQPSSAKDLLQMLENGNKNRTQHPTDANATSSRSHAVFQVFINQKPRAAGLSTEVTQGKMSLIDLAGSERGTVASNNKGARLREGANINKSLLALGNCINALASNKGKTSHVPYRNSKLTRLLKDSLGGNCKTVMIANISPSSLTYEDTYNALKYADRAKQIKTKLVRNVVNVDYHVTRYRTIVVGLQKEIEDLKSQLHISAQPPFNIKEADRLKTVIEGVYNERTRLRKNMADLDAAERDTLLRVLRKEREVQRIEVLTGDDRKLSKLKGKLEFLRNHLQDIKERKTVVHLELSKNNESIGRTLTDINTSVTGESDGQNVLRSHVDLVFDASKLEAENCYQWKQTKHLLKYIKNQEKDISRTEKILVQCLELVCKQYQLLQATNSSTPVVHDLYEGLVKQIEGDKEVGWTDQTGNDTTDLHDVSVSSFAPTHQALMDTIIAHSSPIRKNTNGRYSSPMNAASLGLLTVSNSSHSQSTMVGPLTPKSPSPSITRFSPHPLANRLVAFSDQRSMTAPQGRMSPKSPNLVKETQTVASSTLEVPSGNGGKGQFTSRSPTKRSSPSLHGPLQQEQERSSSPITSPRLKKKKVVFNSPPPVIQEIDEDEIDSNGGFQPTNKTSSLGGVKPTSPPSPPPRKGDVNSTKESLMAFTKLRQEQNKAKANNTKDETAPKPSSPKRKDAIKVVSSSRTSSSPKPNNTSPSKYRINLAELTSISQSPNYNPAGTIRPAITTTTTGSTGGEPGIQTTAIAKPHPIAPVVFHSPVMNAFQDDFVSSYPACTKKRTHTPLGKSASIDNPIYNTKDVQQMRTVTPCRPPPTLHQPSPFRPVPNQHPAFPSPQIPQRVFSPLSPIAQTPQKPAFLPVSKTKTLQHSGYRSPVNIPVHPLPVLPPPPLPSPSAFSKTRTGVRSSSSSVSSSSQGTDASNNKRGQHNSNQGYVLHPALCTKKGSTNAISRGSTKSSHRYSLTSPTQSRDNVFTSTSGSSSGADTSDQLNSTFTITKTTQEKRKYAVLEPIPPQKQQQPTHSSTHSTLDRGGYGTIKPLSVLQQQQQQSGSDSTDSVSISSGDKKQPNYLAMTKSAAFKKVHRTTLANHMKNQKENWNSSTLNNGSLSAKSQSVKLKNKTINRSINCRSHSVSTAS